MKQKVWPLLLLVLLFVASAVHAEVEWQVNQKLNLPSVPVDMAASADGQKIFVLLDGGKVDIFDAAGQLQETIDVGIKADKLLVSPDGTQLMLSKGKEIQMVSLDFIKPIDISGSPFRGPEDAKVVVAVYSDFQ